MKDIIRAISFEHLHCLPDSIERCSEGIGNYVYRVRCGHNRYIIRFTTESGAYDETICWLTKLHDLDIPVPQIIKHGQFQQYAYLILIYLDGEDIGLVYPYLTAEEKKSIAISLVQIQEKVATIRPEIPPDWSWRTFVQGMLDRAENRILQNGYFTGDNVDKLRVEAEQLDDYFSQVKPTAYLDDISSKNLLIHNGHLSGIIDVDWIGLGDKLTYIALTYVALLNMEYDTDYVSFLLEETALTLIQRKAFYFYSLMYCVDFMGERGMCFMDKKVEVNQTIINRLNRIYRFLWNQWQNTPLK